MINAKEEMINAKEEMLSLLEGREVKCAIITHVANMGNKATILLKINHNKEDLEVFLNELDFTYDNGFGGQKLYGTVWFKDDTWAERGGYNGSEWWEFKSLPEIPEELINLSN